MALTVEQLDTLCGGPPLIRLTCPWCVRVVGPYYSAANARLALQTHIAYVHLFDEVKTSPRDDGELKRTSRGSAVVPKRRARVYQR